VMNGAGNAFDCGRLAEHLMLGAWAYGVGSCIGTFFPEENEARAKELLGVPAERWVRQTISLGYPADEHATRVSSTPGTRGALPSLGRKPLSEFASWEYYGKRDR
jgi:nitroreductase